MEKSDQKSIGVVFITYNAKHHLSRCIPPLLNSPLKPRVLVLNSSSKDGTVEEAAQLGCEVLVIPRNEFNHGDSRNVARRYLNTDIVVMMTPDAYAVDHHMLERLVNPIITGQVAMAYARQIPHDNAGPLEAFSRSFNYPAESYIREMDDLVSKGVQTFFCSNSCAAWDNRLLESIGGFSSVLTGEDTLATAMLLKKGCKVAYVAEAVVKHSHDYSIWQEFCRYFDTGYVRKEQNLINELVQQAGRDEKRGKAFVKAQLKEAWKKHPKLLPKIVFSNIAKYMGYRIGAMSLKAPVWFKKRLSSQDFYWK